MPVVPKKIVHEVAGLVFEVRKKKKRAYFDIASFFIFLVDIYNIVLSNKYNAKT